MTVLREFNKDRGITEYFCGICGLPMTQYEVAAYTEEEFVDFTTLNKGGAAYHICRDCFCHKMEILQGGLERAKHMERIIVRNTEKAELEETT